MAPLWDGRTKICSNGPGHMTNMAAMLIYGKNLKKSSLEPKGTVGMQHRVFKYFQVCSNDGPGLTLTYFMGIWSLMLLYRKKVKQWIFQKLM